uniref:Uncharacterized protein n=1 Tax=Glycine max TaxID=3847 RepID=A0A368UIJ5_SOYBN
MSKITILVFLTLLMFTLTTLSCSLFSYNSLLKINKYKQSSIIAIDDLMKKCDIFSGEWVPNLEAPYYTNTTCWEIHEHQNCTKYGRPVWRWKPKECELPIFNPFQSLEIMRGKSMAFSMICLLSRVEWPIDVSYTDDFSFKRQYSSYNFTMATFWSPYLVRSKQVDSNGGLYHVYLDEFDEIRTNQINEFDYEFKIDENKATKKGLKFMLFDSTQAILLRPDGHPNKYGHWPNENVTLYNDCVHWCLPGPIDTWSDFLLEILKMKGMRYTREISFTNKLIIRFINSFTSLTSCLLS